MAGKRGTGDEIGRRRPSLRQAVVAACVLVAVLALPLVWHVTHTLKACQRVTEAYLRGEALRDHAFHLNEVLVHGAAVAVHHPDLVDLTERDLVATQLSDKLLIAKFVRQECQSKCALDRADSIQTTLREREAIAIALACDGRQDEALARLSDPQYHASMQDFVNALDGYAHEFHADFGSALAAERQEEILTLGWVALILVTCAILWFVLLRSVEVWRRRVICEMEQGELARQEMADALERFQNLFDQVYDSIVLVDRRTGQILDANQAATEHLGFSRADLTRMSIDEIEYMPGNPTPEAVTVSSLSTEDVLVKREYRCNDGRRLAVEVSRRQVEDRGRKAVLCLVRDLTQRRQLEAQLCHAQHLESIGRLAAGIAHDLGNTLLAISAHTMSLRKDSGMPTGKQANLARIEIAVSQATAVIKSLLSLADRSVAQPRFIDAVVLFKRSVELLQPVLPAAIELVEEQPPERPVWIHVDPDRVQQALLNLALNACDALPSGGRLDLALVCPAPPGEGSDGDVEFSVSGSNPRNASKGIDRNPDPFFTESPDHLGTGLGLFNVQRITAECHGHLSVSSQSGDSTVFTLHIPRCDTLARSGETREAREPAVGDERTVLLAAAHDFARKVMAEALGAAGYRVQEASSARELRATLAGAGQEYGLAIVNTDLSDDESLKSIARIARRQHPPMILITDRPLREVETLIEGRALILAKPFTMQNLCRLVATALGDALLRKEVS